jgi:hypothetical protein
MAFTISTELALGAVKKKINLNKEFCGRRQMKGRNPLTSCGRERERAGEGRYYPRSEPFIIMCEEHLYHSVHACKILPRYWRGMQLAIWFLKFDVHDRCFNIHLVFISLSFFFK